MSPKNNATLFQERPWVCMIDLDQNVVNALKSAGFNCTSSSFGRILKLEMRSGTSCTCKIPRGSNIPDNLHEFDIVVIDLEDKEAVPYNYKLHTQLDAKVTQQKLINCEYPQTLFDPRPLVGAIYKDVFYHERRETITIVFASKYEQVEYEFVSLTSHGYRREHETMLDNYSFLLSEPDSENKRGVETRVVENTHLSEFLKKYNNDFEYEIVFSHPSVWDGKKNDLDPNFIPLMKNKAGDIVSYAQFINSSIILVFPQMKNKEKFLQELFQKHLPDIARNIFPFSTEFAWLRDEIYRLPNESNLISEKQDTEKEYAAKISEIEQKIDKNRSEHQFLHDLLTETGDKLVKSVEHYFHWLGFTNVINCDESHRQRKEEDLQISHEKGLLVIEVKGIGGTSKDSECSQISKIKHRREKERSAFDVFALYLVNSERYLPPKNRQDPPFTDQQITDAQDDERGLLTTYELFTLYFAIETGIISKEDARKALLGFGRIVFKPSNSTLVGKPAEIHRNNTVGIFNLNNVVIRKNDELIVFESGRYRKIRVVSIMDQNKDVEEVSNGEVGIQFTDKISTTSEFWKPITP